MHQLVSTIEATIAHGQSRAAVVAAAYPPGSMTGAPKISSMDILDGLESRPRGPYSGVVGYFSPNGAADLSVTIRSAVFQIPRGRTAAVRGDRRGHHSRLRPRR